MLKKSLIILKKVVPYLTVVINNNEVILVTHNKNLYFSVNCLKLHINFQYKVLSCISGVDFINLDYRFSVVYELLSVLHNSRLRVKVFVDELSPVNSIVNIFPCANWFEREVWDLYGVFFYAHPDLRRLLTDYGFDGYPMRKDFPLSGFIELKYYSKEKQIMFQDVELSQEFRSFSFDIPW